MKISHFTVNLFQENTYLLSDESNKAIIIDPGLYSNQEKEGFLNYIEKNKIEPIAIVNTHCHIDHILGVNFLKNKFNIPFWANKKEEENLKNSIVSASLYDFVIDDIPKIDKYIDEHNIIEFGKSYLKTLFVPGHTTGHLAFYNDKEKFALTGDVLFKDTIGRTDLPGGNLDVLLKSIFTKLIPLGDDYTIFPGHGPKSTIGIERKNNPFL